MSEQINPSIPPTPAPAPITFDSLKAKLIGNFEMMYQQFCAQLGTIPCSTGNLHSAMRHFDDGFYNFREGIKRLKLDDIAMPANTDQSDAPPAE